MQKDKKVKIIISIVLVIGVFSIILNVVSSKREKDIGYIQSVQ